MAAGCGEKDEPDVGDTETVQLQDASWKEGPTAATEERLPCTTIDEPANFALFWPGPEVGELDLTHILRRCDKPHRAEPGRANTVALIYGTCEIPPEQTDGGCAPPLEIQLAPTCERVAAGIDEGGLRADDSTIQVFGASELRRAVRDALVAIPAATPPAEIPALPAAGASEDLPPPAQVAARGCAN